MLRRARRWLLGGSGLGGGLLGDGGLSGGLLGDGDLLGGGGLGGGLLGGPPACVGVGRKLV